MASKGLIAGGECHVGVNLSVNYITVDRDDVGGRRWVLPKDILRWEGAVTDGVDMIASERSDAGEEHGILDVLFLDDLLNAGQQICLVFKSQDDDAFELSGDRVDVGDFRAVQLGVVLRRGGLGDFDARALGQKRQDAERQQEEKFLHPTIMSWCGVKLDKVTLP